MFATLGETFFLKINNSCFLLNRNRLRVVNYCIKNSNMVHELIKVENKDGDLIVSARELHEYLESRQDFSTWIKNRIKKYGFIEGEDYTSLHKIVERANGATSRIEYGITLDMAKELAMVENNKKGKLARRYFIDCEKKVKRLMPNFSNPPEAARAWANEYESRQRAEAKAEFLQIENTAMKPKAAFFDAVTDSKTAIEMGQVAKLLNYRRIGRNKLFIALRELNILRGNNEPYQTYIDNGCFRVIEQKYSKPDGSIHIRIKTLVFQKGIDMIKRKLDKLGYKVSKLKTS